MKWRYDTANAPFSRLLSRRHFNSRLHALIKHSTLCTHRVGRTVVKYYGSDHALEIKFDRVRTRGMESNKGVQKRELASLQCDVHSELSPFMSLSCWRVRPYQKPEAHSERHEKFVASDPLAWDLTLW